MTDDPRRRFWKTAPGVVTAAAGLVSAIAALIGGPITARLIAGPHSIATSGFSSHSTPAAATSAAVTPPNKGAAPTVAGSAAPPASSTPTPSRSRRPGPSPRPSPSPSSQCTVVALSDASTLRGTYLFDFDSGTETQTGADVWWEQQTATVRSLDPQPGAAIVNLGAVDFASLSCGALRAEAYANIPIDGNNDATNQLTNGDVFAVRTDQGNYVKVQVVSYGYDLELRFETYRPG